MKEPGGNAGLFLSSKGAVADTASTAESWALTLARNKGKTEEMSRHSHNYAQFGNMMRAIGDNGRGWTCGGGLGESTRA